MAVGLQHRRAHGGSFVAASASGACCPPHGQGALWLPHGTWWLEDLEGQRGRRPGDRWMVSWDGGVPVGFLGMGRRALRVRPSTGSGIARFGPMEASCPSYKTMQGFCGDI